MNNYDNCNSPLNNHKPACLDKINQIEKFLKELKNYINSDTDITANSNFTIHETTPKTTYHSTLTSIIYPYNSLVQTKPKYIATVLIPSINKFFILREAIV